MSEKRSLDRLLLPKMRAQPEGVELLIPESSAPLPRWQTLPLDAKFPVTPAAKDEVTFVTTRICQPAYKSTQRETFDLTDPYNRTIQTEYQALCDPYLKDWLAKPYVRKQLLEQNLLTPSGKVACTVRDFNNYRNFLRRQALIKNKEPETLTRASENRKMILQKTKMKAELESVEVKCKSLKARQMLKEAEEDRQRQFWRKQALEIEREQKRLEKEKTAHHGLLKKRREKWIEKQKEIREKEEITRKEHEKKVMQIEMEAQEKLHKVDAMRHNKQHLLEEKRKQHWHQKCQHQMKVLEETTMLQKRVESEIELRRRQYEDKMTSSLVKSQAAAADNVGVTEIVRTAHEDGAKCAALVFMTGQDISQMAHHRHEPQIYLSRRASMWIIEELLYSSGMIEEVNLLFSTRSPREYSSVLDTLIASVMRRTKSASLLGMEQDTLSKIVHLVLRQLEEAYHGKKHAELGQDTAHVGDADAECLKRFFSGIDSSLETERAARVSMSATLDMDCTFLADKNTSDTSSDIPSEHDQRASLFSNHLRLPESDVRQMEAELTQLLIHFQKETRTTHEKKHIFEMFLKLACHDINQMPVTRREVAQNSDKQTLDNAIIVPIPGSPGHLVEGSSGRLVEGSSGRLVEGFSGRLVEGSSGRLIEGSSGRLIEGSSGRLIEGSSGRLIEGSSGRLVEETGCMCLETDSKPLVGSCLENLQSDGGQETDRDTTILIAGAETEKDFLRGDNDSLEEMYGTETSLHHFQTQSTVKTTDENTVKTKSSGENTEDDVEEIISGNETVGSTVTNKPRSTERTDNNSSPSERDEIHDNLAMISSSLDVSKATVSASNCECNNFTDKENVKDYKELVESASSMRIMNASTAMKVEDSAECDAGSPSSAHRINHISSPTRNTNEPSTLPPVPSEHIESTTDNSPGSGMELTKKDEQADESVTQLTDNEVESGIRKECETNHESQNSERQDGDTINIEWSSSSMKTTDDLPVLEEAAMTHKASEEASILRADGKRDVVAMTAQFVVKMRKRELQGIGFPPAKIHYITSMFLSRLWQCAPGKAAHTSRERVYNQDVAATVRSLVYSVKMMRLPQELLNILTNAIVTVILHNFIDYKGCLPEGVIKTTIRGFARELEKKRVSVRILEDVLFTLQEAYSGFVRRDHSFQMELFLVDTLCTAEELLSTGKVAGKEFVKNILDYEQLSRQAQVTLLYSPWKSMLHQAKVAIQLSAISPKDRTQLEYLVLVCGEHLIDEDCDNITECIQQLRSRMGDEIFKLRSVVILSASVVAALLHTVEEKRITDLTLLPDALISVSTLAPSTLEQDNTGEAVVLLALDSLARDMGEDTLDRQCLGHIAASLVDLFTRDYRYQKEALEGEGLAGGLDCMTSRFRYQSLEFTDSCKIMSAILRAYLGYLLMADKHPCLKVDLGERVCVDDDLMSSLFDFITEVFVTFVRGVIARMRRVWVGNELHDDLLVLYVWRNIASLATEVARWNLDVLLGLVETFKGKPDENIPCRRDSDSSHTADTVEESCDQARVDMVGAFMACISRHLREPGYVPVPDLNIPNQAIRNDSTTAAMNKATKETPIPAEVETAARKEILSACKMIFESVISAEVLQEMRIKMADHVACAVVTMDRFTSVLSDKMWALKDGLSSDNLTLFDIVPFLVSCESHAHLEVVISKEVASRILTLIILELETIQKSVSVLCKVVESLSRIAQQLTGVRGHASSILSAISSATLAQFIRAFITFALKTVAWLLDRTCNEKTSTDVETPLRLLSSDVTKLAIDVVWDRVKFLKQLARKETKIEDGWAPRDVAGTAEDSVLRIPSEICDNVFGCMADIIQIVGTTENGIDMVSPSPSDIVVFFITQILTSVTSFVDTGTFPFISINDLLCVEKPSKTDKFNEATNAGSNNASTRQKQEIKDLLTSLELNESEYLLKLLIQITTSVSNVLKQEINAVVLVNKSCDSLLQASAFMNVKLGKVRQDLAKKCVILSSNLQQSSDVSFTGDVRKPSGVKSGDGDSERNVNICSIEPQKNDDRKMPVSHYIENLFRNVTDVKRTNNGLNIHPARVIHAILKACYTVDIRYLVCDSARMNRNSSNSLSLLLMEIMINELYNRLGELEKARTKEIDKETNYPYLFSRIYTIPDPWGPYYSDVAVRARQLSDTVRVGSVTRNQVQRLSAVSSLISNREGSLICESSRADEEVSSVVCEDGTTISDTVHDMRRSSDRRRQTRVATWRRKVKDSSTVHSTDNTLKLWVKNEAKMSRKMSGFQKESKIHSTAKQINTFAVASPEKAEPNKIDPEDSQAKNGQNSLKCHKRSLSAQNVDQKYKRSAKQAILSVSKKVVAGKIDKQQIKRIPEKTKNCLKESKDGSSKTNQEMRETAAQKHISRMTRRSTSVKSRTKSTDLGSRNGWPKTVHIIHHAYTDRSNTVGSPTHGENKVPGISTDESLNQLTEGQPSESQTQLKPYGIISETQQGHPCDQQESAPTRVLMSLLTKELPQQTTAVCRCLGKEATDALGNDDLATALSVIDLALIELDHGDEVEAMRVLKGDCAKEKVSQRAAGALNNLLRSVMNNLISDGEISEKLTDDGTGDSGVDIHSFRQQLIAYLSVMVQRVEEGSKVPEIFSGREAEILDVLRHVRETSQNTEAVGQEEIREEDSYASDVGSTAGEYQFTGCKTNTNSLTPSCNTALTSASDDDSNDDKCIMSSSWTILSSCPSLSSSRSSNVAQIARAEGASENNHGKQQQLRGNPNPEGCCENSKEGQLSGGSSKMEIACDIKDDDQPSGRYSVEDNDGERSSRADTEYNHSDELQFSGRSSRAEVSEKSDARQLSGKSSKAENGVDDQGDDWPVSGHSSKTPSGQSYNSDRRHLGNRPAAGSPCNTHENRQASGRSSWSSSPKTSRCSSAQTSRNEDAISCAHSLSSTSTTSTRSEKQKDTRAASRSSKRDISLDRDITTQSGSVAARSVKSSGEQWRDNSTDQTLDGPKGKRGVSEVHGQSDTVPVEATAQNDSDNDRYSTDDDSSDSEDVNGRERGRKLDGNGVMDLGDGRGVSDVEEDCEM